MKSSRLIVVLAALLLVGMGTGISVANSKPPKVPPMPSNPPATTTPSTSTVDPNADIGDLETGNTDSSEDDNAPPEGGAPPPPDDSSPPASPATPPVQAPTTQTTPVTTTAADPTVTKTETSPQPSPPSVTTQAEPPAPPPPLCLNHPDFPKVPDGWRRGSDGNCNEIPKLDLQLSGPSTVQASGGTANFTVTIVNNGSTLASGVLFKQELDANGMLSLVNLKASQGDPFGKVDDRTFVCSIGTIRPGQSATVSISLKAVGTGSVTVGAVEPGGEADTNTDNNHLTTTVMLTALQTQRTVQQHGLLWGGHYYGSVTDFARVLAREGIIWRGWKATHSALAAGLIAHDKPSRRH